MHECVVASIVYAADVCIDSLGLVKAGHSTRDIASIYYAQHVSPSMAVDARTTLAMMCAPSSCKCGLSLVSTVHVVSSWFCHPLVAAPPLCAVDLHEHHLAVAKDVGRDIVAVESVRGIQKLRLTDAMLDVGKVVGVCAGRLCVA